MPGSASVPARVAARRSLETWTPSHCLRRMMLWIPPACWSSVMPRSRATVSRGQRRERSLIASRTASPAYCRSTVLLCCHKTVTSAWCKIIDNMMERKSVHCSLQAQTHTRSNPTHVDELAESGTCSNKQNNKQREMLNQSQGQADAAWDARVGCLRNTGVHSGYSTS